MAKAAVSKSDQQAKAGSNEPVWGSDVLAETLRELGFPYVTLVPGASFTGLHDSIVNHLGNQTPKMLLCLHEEHTAFIASGYAQVAGEPLPIIVHTNVGLMHASIGIHDAWCGRQPMLVIGTSSADAERRTPWIDWIHTMTDEGSMVRNFLKWDDKPQSVAAAVDSIRRANLLARAEPQGPAMVIVDRKLQEDVIEARPQREGAERYQPPGPAEPASPDVAKAVELIKAAKKPLIMAGRVSRSEEAWSDRVRFAEMLGAEVFTYNDDAAAFPIPHPCHTQRCSIRLTDAQKTALRSADLIIELDWVDFGAAVRQAWPPGEASPPPIISCANDHLVHRGGNMDYFTFAPADVRLGASPDRCISALLTGLEGYKAQTSPHPASGLPVVDVPASGPITKRTMAAVYYDVVENEKVCMAEMPIGWPADLVRCSHPMDFLAGARGGDVGAGCGTATGAALALRHLKSDRLPIAIMGDGDYLMGVTALWTAAANEIPMLILVANNRAYGNDVGAQHRTAVLRGRPVENKWVGQAINDPPPDVAGLARDLGLEGDGPITDIANLRPAIEKGIERLKAGKGYVIDVVVTDAD